LAALGGLAANRSPSLIHERHGPSVLPAALPRTRRREEGQYLLLQRIEEKIEDPPFESDRHSVHPVLLHMQHVRLSGRNETPQFAGIVIAGVQAVTPGETPFGVKTKEPRLAVQFAVPLEEVGPRLRKLLI